MKSSRRLPWLSGLIAALVGTLWLVADVVRGVLGVLSSAIPVAPM